MSSGSLIIVVNDMHINSTVGLALPTFPLDDGGMYKASPGQRWLYQCWIDFCEQAKRAARGRKVYLFVNGDAVEADAKSRSIQLITRNKSRMLRHAVDLLLPVVNMADRLFVIRGTGAHVGKSGQFEEELAVDLVAEKAPSGSSSWWWWLGEIERVRLEVAHHGAGGGQVWTASGGVVRLAAQTVLEYAGYGDPIPRLVLRGHGHQYRDSFDNVMGCRAVMLPAWTLATEHVHRIGRGRDLAQIGGGLITCEKGRFDLSVVQYRPARQSVWRESQRLN